MIPMEYVVSIIIGAVIMAPVIIILKDVFNVVSDPDGNDETKL